MSSKATHSSNISSPQLYLPKRLGVILREADLVTKTEIKTALEYQKLYPCMRLGEILAIQGWIRPETVEFFAEEWQQLIEHPYRKPIGHYLQQAALLETQQIKRILDEQRYTGYKFGSTAVLQGYLKPKTLDFFLKYLFPEELNQSHMRNRKSLAQSRTRQRKLLAQILERKHNPWKK